MAACSSLLCRLPARRRLLRSFILPERARFIIPSEEGGREGEGERGRKGGREGGREEGREEGRKDRWEREGGRN